MYSKTALLAALCAALTLGALNGSAQTSKGKIPKTKDYYLLESKRQKSAGWITLATGFDEYQYDEKKDILKGIGFTSMVSGAVLLVIGTINKKKASRISVKSRHSGFIHSSQTITKVQPGLSIKIDL